MPFAIPIAILGPIAIWGAQIGLSVTAITGLLTAVSYGITTAVGIGLQFLGNALFAPKAPKPEDRQGMVREPTSPRFRSYGRVKVGGTLVYLTTKSGRLYRVIAMGHGEIDAVESHWIDDQQVTLNGSNVVTDPPHLLNRLEIDHVLGTSSQTAYADLIAAAPTNWTSAHQGNGIPHALVTLYGIGLDKFQRVYPRGEPAYRQIQRAAKVYDPRDPAQDSGDASTWLWSENAALIIRDYFTHADGMNLAQSFFTDASWETAADICDELVNLKGGGTVARYKISTSYSFDERPADVLARMFKACDARVFPTASGGLGITVGKWVTPTVTITDDAIIDYDMSKGRGTIDVANVIKSKFTYPENGYQSADADEWRDEASVTARGELKASVDFMAAPNHSQCRRLMKVEANRLNPGWSGMLTCNMMGLAVLGERFITVQLSELEIDETFEITGDPEFIIGDGAQLMGIRFTVAAMPSTAYDWDAEAEEGTAPPEGDEIEADIGVEDMDNLAASVEQRIIANGNSVAVAVITWDAPVAEGLSPQIELKLTSGDDTTWQRMSIAEDQLQTESGILIDGESYDLRGRFAAGGGHTGDWTAPLITFTATANLTAPADVTGVTATGGVGQVTIGLTTPNDVNFVKARIYRNAANNSASATLVATYFLAANTTTAIIVGSQPVGTFYYWVAAANGSNIEATRVASSPASVVIT